MGVHIATSVSLPSFKPSAAAPADRLFELACLLHWLQQRLSNLPQFLSF